MQNIVGSAWLRGFVLVSTVALASCGSVTPVTPIGPDTYMIANKSNTAFATGGEMMADLYREANAYCAKEGKRLMPVNSASRDGAPYRKATGELQFMCLEQGDTELARPKMQREPDVKIQVK